MSEIDEFLEKTVARQIITERSLHNGDPSPRLAMWSHKDPVTLYGAAVTKSGWDQLEPFFKLLASRFSNCTQFEFEVAAAGASGDLAYTVGYERTSVSVDGKPVDPYTLRVTHIYRREDGEWKIVHRHADNFQTDQAPLTF